MTVLRRPPRAYVADRGSVTAVHQFLPALLPGDACGIHTLEAQRALREAGFESEVFCEAIHEELEGRGHHFSEFAPYAKGSALIYHLATGSVLADFVNARPEPLVVDYHNLTPAEFFRRWDITVANAMSWGRSQLAMLSSRAAIGLADSTYNEQELIHLDYAMTAVVPILLKVDATGLEVDAARRDRLEADRRERSGRPPLRRATGAQQGPGGPDQGPRPVPPGLRSPCPAAAHRTTRHRELRGRR